MEMIGKVVSLFSDKLSRLVIAFLPRSKHLLISQLQSLPAVILEPKEIKSVTVYELKKQIHTLSIEPKLFRAQHL